MGIIRRGLLTIFALFCTAVVAVSCSSGTQPTIDDDENIPLAENPDCLSNLGANDEWSNETEVAIVGYTGNAMEPRLSADQNVILWNDKPASGDSAMNIHYAVKQPDGRYQYIGPMTGANDGASLDGVPALDANGNFYFVSLRDYAASAQSIFGGQFVVTGPNAARIDNVIWADSAVSLKKPGTVDMDIDVSWDGTLMVVSRAQFSGQPTPDTSQLVMFNVSGRAAYPLSASSTQLANVNLGSCRVYAGALSQDKRELYYTVLPKNSNEPSRLRIAVAKRSSETEAFGPGAIVRAAAGTATEGPTISMDGRTMIYHKLDTASGQFKLYKLTR